MHDFGLVSIITPSYNCAAYIGETIESILTQTYQNWELLITDDCSTDNSCEIIQQYVSCDPRIKLFKLEKNSGAGVARNNSIEHARGRYIAFCDSDDRWLPDKLHKQIKLMDDSGESVCYSSYLTCDEAGNTNGIVVAYRQITFREMLRDDSMGFLTCIYDTKNIGKVYMPEIRKRQDWALKIKLLKKVNKAIGTLEPLAIYRLHENSLSNNKFKLIKYNVKVYQEVLNYTALHAWVKFFFDFMPHYVLKKMRLRIINQ